MAAAAAASAPPPPPPPSVPIEAFLARDPSASRALYGVAGSAERLANAEARIRDAIEPPGRLVDLVRGDGPRGAAWYEARKRARYALVPREAIPRAAFQVHWLAAFNRAAAAAAAPPAAGAAATAAAAAAASVAPMPAATSSGGGGGGGGGGPRADRIPWLAFVNALRVRMMGLRRVVRVDLRDTRIVVYRRRRSHTSHSGSSSSGDGDGDGGDLVDAPLEPLPHGVHARLEIIEDADTSARAAFVRVDEQQPVARYALAWPLVAALYTASMAAREAPAPVWRVFAVYTRNFGGTWRVRTLEERRARLLDYSAPGTKRAIEPADVSVRAVPLAEPLHDRAEFAVAEAGVAAAESFVGSVLEANTDDALVPDFPRYDSLLWFGVACTYVREPVYTRDAAGAAATAAAAAIAKARPVTVPVRLVFPRTAPDPDTRHRRSDGRIVCAHDAELVFVKLDAAAPPSDPVALLSGCLGTERTSGAGVRLRARISLCGDRVRGETDAAPGVQPLHFELRPFDNSANSSSGSSGSGGGAHEEFVSMTFVPREALA